MIQKKIHFMGIGGSGMSAIALIASAYGYDVEGSDLQDSTPYLDKVRERGIKVYQGHETSMLTGIDILTVTPAVFFKEDQSFVNEAKKMGILVMTWQKFMGEYLHRDKSLICIAGAHGKSTTTAWSGILFEEADLDPTVEVGATVKKWSSNVRVGDSKYFISEADEFYDNFLNYSPETIVLTNVEYEHPDYFKTEDQLFQSYEKFVRRLKNTKNLIVNMNDEGIGKLISNFDDGFVKDLNMFGYSVFGKEKFVELPNHIEASDVRFDNESTKFVIISNGKKENYEISLLGEHNVYNSLAVIALAKMCGVSNDLVRKTLKDFDGTGRRLELIGNKDDIYIYDDYAHHPTEIKASLSAIKQKHPHSEIWAIIEPHSFSRTKVVISLYDESFENADHVLIAPIFKARDTEDFGISSQTIVESSHHRDIKAYNSSDEIIQRIIKVNKNSVVVIMGAGKSYQIAKDLLEQMK